MNFGCSHLGKYVQQAAALWTSVIILLFAYWIHYHVSSIQKSSVFLVISGCSCVCDSFSFFFFFLSQRNQNFFRLFHFAVSFDY